MAEERIDIKVTDSGSDKAAKGLRAIASEATKAQKALDQVSARLSTLPAAQLNAMANAAARAADASTRVAAAEQKASSAINGTKSAMSAASAEGARAVTVIDRRTKSAEEAARAEARFSAAQKEWMTGSAGWQKNLSSQNAEFAKRQQEVVDAEKKVAASMKDTIATAQRENREFDSLRSRSNALKSSLDPLYAAQVRFDREMREANALLRSGAINMKTYSAAVSAAKVRIDAAKASQDRFGGSARMASHHQATLVSRISDMGMSLASGQNPFSVLAQQGSQLQNLSMRVDGGFKTLARSVLSMINPFTLAAAAAGALAAAWWGVEKSSVALSKAATGLGRTAGLTGVQLKELADGAAQVGEVSIRSARTQAAAYISTGKIGGEIISGLIAVSKDYASFMGVDSVKATKDLAEAFSEPDKAAREMTRTFGLMDQETLKTIDSLIKQGDRLGAQKILMDEVAAAMKGHSDQASELTSFWDVATRAMSNYWTKLGEFLHTTRDERIDNLEMRRDMATNPISRGMFERSGNRQRLEDLRAAREADRAKAAEEDSLAAANQAAQAAKDVYDKGKAERNKAAREAAAAARTAAREAAAAAREAAKLAEARRRVDDQLDNEISRMGMLKREREVQQRFDQIEEQLLRSKITLNDTEAKQIRDKIELLQREGEIQSAMDGIYEDINGATLKYNATLEAATRLLDAGRISYEQYTQAVNKAKLAHDSALDPLLDMGVAQDAAMRAARLYGVEAQKAAYYEQVRNQLMREGIILSAQYVQGENAKVDALMRGNAELLRQQQANSVIGSIVDPLKEKEEMLSNEQFYYDELKRLREENYINEEQYALASASIARKYDELKLQNASDFFSALAGLSSSSNRELAAIGKAAAITQATINTFLAVSEAMRVPWPANLPLMAQAAAQGAALVGQISSISAGNFATGGQVMVGGRDGVDKNNVNMNVTKGERITIETPAQQKATDAAIANGQGGGGANVNVSNINVVDPRFVIDSMDTTAGSRVITNIITANKREINAILGSR